jgi:acetyl-CoA C-acetyltransferase
MFDGDRLYERAASVVLDDVSTTFAQEPMILTSDAYIVASLRTPIGKFGGALAPVSASELTARVLQAVLERSGVPSDEIGEVIVSQSYASGEAPCMGRYGALLAGLPTGVPGYTVDRRCGSGLQAIVNAAMQIQTGVTDAVLVAGVESMSNVEYYATEVRRGARLGSIVLHDRLERGRQQSQPESRFGPISGMPETVENLVREYGVTREEADSFAVRSHRYAALAWQEGRFGEEVISISVPQKKAEPLIIDRDEGIRPQTDMVALSRLPPLLPGGTVTAGNSSQQNDAAAACLVVSGAFLERHHLVPEGKLVGWAAVGCDPRRMGIGPVPACSRLFSRIGLSLADMDLIEINEAFAGQVLCVLREWGLETDLRVNVNGSGIALGHPIGATGVRIMATLLHQMKRRGARFGLETMCVGGGQGVAAVFERVDT